VEGPTETDARIIEASRENPECFSQIFDRHFRPVLSYLRRRVGNEAAADLVSETFVRAFEGRGSYELSREDARPWLLGIATNLIRHHLRDERIHLEALARVPPTLSHYSPLEELPAQMDGRAALARIAHELLGLPEVERDALLLYAWGELPYEEIARSLGVPVGTVRSRINRARTRLSEPDERDVATTN